MEPFWPFIGSLDDDDDDDAIDVERFDVHAIDGEVGRSIDSIGFSRSVEYSTIQRWTTKWRGECE